MDLSFIKSYDLDKGGVFIIMVGPPGSGKTTIAKELEDEYGFSRVSPDEIRLEITGSMTNQTRNDEVFGIVYSRLEDLLMAGENVVYDATNCRSRYRYKILDATQALSNEVICICLTTPIIECLKQNQKRIFNVPEDVIEKMYFALKNHPPTIFEGYDAIIKA